MKISTAQLGITKSMTMFHEGQRALQDRYEGRHVADRLEQHRRHSEFSDDDRQFIENAAFFFLASAWGDSVDCSIKGGTPGFVQVIGPKELVWPDYDGNRMYRSLGNIVKNPAVGLLFVQFDGSETKLRINGRARIEDSSPILSDFVGAKRLIHVTAEHIYPNCPRYLPQMETIELSPYAPRKGHVPPEPDWKSRDYIRDALDRE